MQAEDFLFDDCSEWEVVKQICEVLPHVCIAILPEALVVKAVDLSDLSRLVIASEDGNAVFVANF